MIPNPRLQRIHHIALICSNYAASKYFYTHILGLDIAHETYREERRSYKLDLSLHGHIILELFSFPDTPPRLSQPEACGLRHLAFAVDQLESMIDWLLANKIIVEPIRLDPITGQRFTFTFDPDDLPIELYETGTSQTN